MIISYRDKAEKAIRSLSEFGFPIDSNPGFGANRINLENLKRVSMSKKNMITIFRLIRDLTNLEKTGEVIPDIDRLGNFVGWHLESD